MQQRQHPDVDKPSCLSQYVSDVEYEIDLVKFLCLRDDEYESDLIKFSLAVQEKVQLTISYAISVNMFPIEGNVHNGLIIGPKREITFIVILEV